MRDERDISFGAEPFRKLPPSPYPDTTGCITQHQLIFGKCIIPGCSLYYIIICSIVICFVDSLQMTEI